MIAATASTSAAAASRDAAPAPAFDAGVACTPGSLRARLAGPAARSALRARLALQD